MDFSFTAYPTVLNTTPVTCVNHTYIQQHINTLQKQQQLCQLIDTMGHASSIAQQLPSTITTYSKFMSCIHNQTLFIATSLPNHTLSTYSSNTVYGYIKVGYKNLFYYTKQGSIVELHNQLCVLDFYVTELYQRTGIGKLLFDTMLSYCNIVPAKLAYDRPSRKFISFLAKYCNLIQYIPQRNNYVIFDTYFNTTDTITPRSIRSHTPPQSNTLVQQQMHNAKRYSNSSSQPNSARTHSVKSIIQPDSLDQLVHTHRTQRGSQSHNTGLYNRSNSNSQYNSARTTPIPFNDMTNTLTAYAVTNPLTSKSFEINALQQRINQLQHDVGIKSVPNTAAQDEFTRNNDAMLAYGAIDDMTASQRRPAIPKASYSTLNRLW